MNMWGVTFGGYLAKILSFKSGNLLYKTNFYLLSEGTVLQSPELLFSFKTRGRMGAISFKFWKSVSSSDGSDRLTDGFGVVHIELNNKLSLHCDENIN